MRGHHFSPNHHIREGEARTHHLGVGEEHWTRGVTGHPALFWSRVVERMDQAVAQVLRVQPEPLVPREAVATTICKRRCHMSDNPSKMDLATIQSAITAT